MNLIKSIEHIMFRFMEASWLKVVISTITAMFIPHLTAIYILTALIIFDTILGSWIAIMAGNFTSTGMKKTPMKVMMYSISIIVVKLLEVLIASSKVTMILKGLFVYLSLIESKSIFENLARMGLPIPNDVLSIIKKLPYSGLINVALLENTDIAAQTRMIREIKPIIKNKILVKIMRLEWNVWVEFSENILNMTMEDEDKEGFKNAVELEVQMAIRTIKNRWRKNKLPESGIIKYKETRDPHLNVFNEYLEFIYENHESLEDSKKLIVKSVTLCLQNIFEHLLKDK